MRPPTDADAWVGVITEPLPLGEALSWAVRPGCGGVVAFAGTVRDHADGRPGVISVEYEAYAEQAGARMHDIAAAARLRWPAVGRVALLHRVGLLDVGEASVLVVVSTPHRDEAFRAARWCIDTVKTTVPIWKRETWSGGAGWGTGAHTVEELGAEQARGGSRAG
ncbi:MAG: molybdenum cofactor biosynthesis protein MoaE [Acidimicrobiales bacterium]